MGFIGYIAAAIYLISCFIAILNLKGFAWAIGTTVTGVIAFFPIWGALFWGFNSSFIWIMFFITIADAVIEGKKIGRNVPRKIEESDDPVFPPLLSEMPGTPEYERTEKMWNNLEDVEEAVIEEEPKFVEDIENVSDDDIKALETELEEMKKRKVEAEKKKKEEEAKQAAEVAKLTKELEKLKKEVKEIENS
tara:strand:+ start:33 stop:608 length:576 start_codon:yes stop_codon:yes gene_type:complete